MILAVSDMHIGYEKSNKDDFLRFLDEFKSEKYSFCYCRGCL